jgi:TolB-like protein/DNA-binding winged helix-turn-helix (wHTH) protein/Tfp pilus assembly protein PilF
MTQPASPRGPRVRFGFFDLDTQTGELRKSGHKVSLRPQASKILALLLSRPGELVTREELKEKVWGSNTFVDFENGLNFSIRQIRAALNDDADTPRYVETLPRRGYRFIAPVDIDRLAQPEINPASSNTASKGISWAGIGIAASILIAIAGILVLADPGRWRERMGGGTAVRTVAVLPLQNLSGDASQDYFADGMTEALTTDLAQMENLQVISRTSTMQYKSTKKSLPDIARELKADVIVEGSVQRTGNKVRITAQLIRATTDKHVWAQTYDRDLSDVLALQDEIASSIAQEIETRLGGPKPVRSTVVATVSPEAYETYLKANYYLDQFQLQKAIEYYNEAIKLDPNYAPTYAHMADAYFFQGFFGWLPPREAWGKLKDAATLAVQKDDRLAEGHGALALGKLQYDWDFKGAEAEFRRALELNPSDADIHHSYAHYLMAMGRIAESEAETQRGVELDPMGDGLNSCLCWHSFAARDYERSLNLARRFLASQPDNFWEHTILGWTYEQKKMPEEAIPEFKKAVDATGGASFFVAALGHGYAMAGKKADAQQVLQALAEKSKKTYVSPFDVALIYAALGDKDTAFTWLDKAIDERSTFLVYSKWEPRLDPLRSDPRFKNVLDRVGLH